MTDSNVAADMLVALISAHKELDDLRWLIARYEKDGLVSGADQAVKACLAHGMVTLRTKAAAVAELVQNTRCYCSCGCADTGGAK